MKLIIQYHKNGRGLTARCSGCGKVIRRATQCNRAGLVYAKAGAEEDFARHKCKKAPANRLKNNSD